MFYIFLSLILLPSILDYTQEKSAGLKISFFFLFFLAAFQHGCTNDFYGYYGYWKRIISGNSGDLELVYCLLVNLFKPIGYYGWLIICAAFNMSVYYWLVKKYVKPGYYWLTILIFTLWTRFFLLMVNCNRQALAVTFIVLMTERLCSSYRVGNTDTEGGVYRICGFQVESLLLSIVCFLIAVNIHTTGIVALIIYPIVFLCSRESLWNHREYIILALTLIFVLRYFVDISFVANNIKAYFLEQHSHFAYLTEQIGRSGGGSLFLTLLYLSYILLLGYYLKKLTLFERVMGLSFIVAVFIQPLFMKDMERLMMYFQVLFPILSVVLINKISSEHFLLKSYFVTLVLVYGVNNIINAPHNVMYQYWFDNFDLIFLHPWR